MHKYDFEILSIPGQVEKYVDQIIDLADANKKELGFLQKAVFWEQANRGRLWVAVSSHSDECFGFLLFGGRDPTLKVFQLYVKKNYRKSGIGKKLIASLITWGEKYNYLTISARVAADLSANVFWEREGFSLIRQEGGGRSAGRMINIRVRELDTPSILNMMSCHALAAKSGIHNIQLLNRPIVNIQTYVLDLNIFFDIIRNRVHRVEAANLITAGLSQEARVIVTPEFVKELERNSSQDKPDPVLEFARTLPVLPKIPDVEIEKLMLELEPLIFPGSLPSGRQKVQSISDLTHLAYCIHHRTTGFITREKAILAANAKLQERYLLEVLSPADLVQVVTPQSRAGNPVNVYLGNESVYIAPTTEAQRNEVERFLISRGVSQKDLSSIWAPGSISSPRRRLTARLGDKDLIAVASWDSPNSISHPTNLHFYIDETSFRAETVIDHILEVALGYRKPGVAQID
jgi:GNAT superfamily N-acetyltransferase/predicted nucleic acid-binding protein